MDLSSVYFDVLKDRLYTSAPKSPARRAAQTALYRLLDSLVRLLAPLMSFTAEEVWGHMNRPESVHMAFFPEPGELSAGLDDAARKRSANWDRLMEVRDVVLKSLDTARNEKLIGAPLEARVILSANAELLPLLKQYAGQLPGSVHRLRSRLGILRSRTRRESGTRLGHQMRALLEVYEGRRQRRRIPHHLRAVRRRRPRDTPCLTCAGRPTEPAALVFALDRFTKWLVETNLSAMDTYHVIPGFFDIVHSENRGVAFGILNDSTSEWRTALLVILLRRRRWSSWRPCCGTRSASTASPFGAVSNPGRRYWQCLRPRPVG